MSDKQKKIVLIIGGGALILLLIILILVSHHKSGPSRVQEPYPAGRVVPTLVVQPTTAANAAYPQVLQITLAYNGDTKDLSVVKKVQINGVAHATTDQILPYELWEIDADNTIIFDTRFAVSTAMFSDSPYNQSGMQQLPQSETTISVPFAPNAKTIIVTKDNKKVLVFPIK